MTNLPLNSLQAPLGSTLKKRYRKEKKFKMIGMTALLISLGFLTFLVSSISLQGAGAFFKTEIRFKIDSAWNEEVGRDSYLLLRRILKEEKPDLKGRKARKDFSGLIGANAEDTLIYFLSNPNQNSKEVIWLPTSDTAQLAIKAGLDPAAAGKLSAQQMQWLNEYQAQGNLRTRFTFDFLTNGDSRDAERAGLKGAIIGSILTLLICFALSFFIGVMAAIYLEEFAPQNKFTAFIEVNINNLASVPSIIFGLLGLAIFLNLFGMPRSSSLVGGIVLALMTLPTIIITARTSLKSIPPWVREAALALGASEIQACFHHVIPLALPGMLTGAILGMARALGETAPLLMIGMVAFIADSPSSFTDPATSMPVQIFLWSDSPEKAFAEKTAGAIIVLITFLILMNLSAVLLRKKFEKKW
jgi:phosphate transport system permease protein